MAFQTGECKKGKDCKYLHQKGKSRDRSPSPARSERGRDRSPKNIRASSQTRSDVCKVPCKFFADGKCTRGDKCPFLHAPKPSGGGAVAADASGQQAAGGMAARGGSSLLSRSASAATLLAGLLTCVVPAETFSVTPSLPAAPRYIGVLPSSFVPPLSVFPDVGPWMSCGRATPSSSPVAASGKA